MKPIKTTNNLTFDVKCEDGTKQEVETGILMEVLPDGKHIVCHLGTGKASHIFSFILALEEMINKCGLDEVYKKYREEFAPNYEDKEDSFDMMPQSEGGTNQWISVKNKLPDIEQEVLIQLSWDDMNVVMGMLTNDGWESNVASFKDDEVLYWQPLPTPYIESENKEIKKAAVVEND